MLDFKFGKRAHKNTMTPKVRGEPKRCFKGQIKTSNLKFRFAYKDLFEFRNEKIILIFH